jgi:hypothetical protein
MGSHFFWSDMCKSIDYSLASALKSNALVFCDQIKMVSVTNFFTDYLEEKTALFEQKN